VGVRILEAPAAAPLAAREVPLGEDCRDWAQKLSDHERNLLTQIFPLLHPADVEVQDCYTTNMAGCSSRRGQDDADRVQHMETVHIGRLQHLLDTIGMPETEYTPSCSIRR